MRKPAAVVACAGCLATAALGVARDAGAVQAATDNAPAAPGRSVAGTWVHEIAGRVVVRRDAGDVPLGGAWVTLHRVSRASAGPVDSVRSDARGRFAFRIRDDGDGAGAYFVSTAWAGLMNFSERVGDARVNQGPVELAVYDTTSAGPALPVASRHVVVAAPNPDGSRTVSELFVVLNAGNRTRVSSGHRATFEATLPPGVLRARPADGDVAAASLSFAAGRIRARAPIAPGTKRIAVAYDLPAGMTTLPVEPNGGADLLELLVEDSAGVAIGPGIREEAPAAVDGRMFRRFLANTVPDTAHVFVRVRGAGSGATVLDAVLVVVAAMTAAMAASLVHALRRPDRPKVATAPPSG